MALARVRLTLCTKQGSCPAGEYIAVVNGGDKCVKCQGGKYREATDADQRECRLCPAGKMEGTGSDRKSESSSCTEDCTAGYYCETGTETATLQCPKGYYCPTGSQTGTSRKCHAGFYCPPKSSTGEKYQCKEGYYCSAGSYDKFGKDVVNWNRKPCECGYYCPSGSSSPTQKKCKDTYDGSTRTVYCPSGSKSPLPIPDGWLGDRMRGYQGPHCYIRGAPKGRYSTRQTLRDGFPSGMCCPAGRYNSKMKQTSCSSQCTAGYYCPECSKEDAVQECGKNKDATMNARYTQNYAASIYCPRGTDKHIQAKEKDEYTTAVEFKNWGADLSPADDVWLTRRTNIAPCPKTYVCRNGVRAPALLWQSCGGTSSKTGYTTNANFEELPDDIRADNKDSLSILYDRQLSKKIVAKLSFADDALGPVQMSITDTKGGSKMWRGNSDGQVSLVAGYGIDYEAKNGGSSRMLQNIAQVEIINLPGTYIETQKACKVNVNVINTNDRPQVYRRQILTIEEQSPVESLVQRPVQALDADKGQTFVFELVSTWNDEENSEIKNSNDQPFTLGKCSGIFKVKHAVLLYDPVGGQTAIRQYRMKVMVKDVDQNDDNFGKTNCTDHQKYCQKESTIVDVYVKVLNKNDPPVITNGQTMQITENVPIGQSIGMLDWNDPDSEDFHIFRIVRLDDHDALAVDGSSGEVTAKKYLDYETKNNYTIKISVTDSGGWRKIPMSDSAWLSVVVLDGNDAPTIDTVVKGTVKEGENNKTVIDNLCGEDVDAESDWGLPLIFSFYDDSAAAEERFSLEKNTENNCYHIKTKSNADIDFESFADEKSAEYEFKIRGKDQGGMYSEAMSVTISVRDVNEKPSLNADSTSLKEDTEKGTKLKNTPVCSDQDRLQVVYYSLHSDSAQTPFTIDKSTGELTYSGCSAGDESCNEMDFEDGSGNSYTLTIVAEDNGSPPLQDTAEWVVTVTDVNEKPEVEQNQEREVTEDALNGHNVNKDADSDAETTNSSRKDVVIVSDEDTNVAYGEESLVYEITSGNEGDTFDIDAHGQISVKNKGKLNYEDKKKYTLLVKATDENSQGESDEASVVINVRDANEAPTLKKKKTASGEEINLIERDVDEESESETNVGDPLVCVEEDKSDKSKAGKCIATCSIIAHAEDEKGESSIDSTYFLIDEDRQIQVNKDTTAPKYSLYKAVFVKVRCEDTGGEGSEEYIKININEKNAPPSITVKNFTVFEDVAEGRLVGSKLVAEDQEVTEGSQSLTWSISSGNSKDIFSIDSSTGQLKIKSTKNLDFEELADDDGEAKITLSIKVEDNDAKSPATDTEDIKVKILDVNEKPELDADDFSGSVKEDAGKATEIGDPLSDFDDVDPENKTVTYAIVKGNEDGLFSVDEATGQITLEKGDTLDYESKKEYEITVRIYEPDPVASVDYRGNTHITRGGKECQDWDKQDPREHSYTSSKYKTAGLKKRACRDPNARGTIWCFTEEGTKEWDYCDQQLTQDAKLTIEVQDVNDAPTAKLPKSALNVYEDAENGAKVGKPIIGDDEDSGDTVSYSWDSNIEGADTLFDISSSSGQITVKDASLLNFEHKSIYHPVVLVNDTKLTASVVTDINILDVNESPEVQEEIFSISEDVSSENELITLSITDPDNGDSHSCRIISGNTDNAFQLDASQHTLKIGNESAVNFESGTTEYSIRVKCTDVEGEEHTASVKITIEDSNEPPKISSQKFDLTENSASNLIVVEQDKIGIEDDDDGGEISNHTIRILKGDPANMFYVDGHNIKLNGRQWSSNSSSKYSKPITVHSRSNRGGRDSAVTCPENHVISFGFAAQQSGGKGTNYASWMRLKGGFHVKEAHDQIGNKMWDINSFELGIHSHSMELPITNSRFGRGISGSLPSSSAPEGWSSSGSVAIIKSDFNEWDLSSQEGFVSNCSEKGDVSGSTIRKSGDGLPADLSIQECSDSCTEDKSCFWWVYESGFCWNKGDGLKVEHSTRIFGPRHCNPESSDYFIALIGRGSAIQQNFKNLPANEQVKVKFRMASLKSTSYLQVNLAGFGRIFPPTGGVKNAAFGESVDHNGFVYKPPLYWSLGGVQKSGHSGVVIIKSCNKVWGGLCSESGSSYFVALHRSKTSILQRVINLPQGKMDLKFNVASRPGYGTEEKITVLINGVEKLTMSPTEYFETKSIQFYPDGLGMATVEFRNDSPDGNFAVLLDAVVIETDSEITSPYSGQKEISRRKSFLLRHPRAHLRQP